MKQLPTISVVIATYNSSETLSECLQSISMQDYPSKLIDIIFADGGSTDATFTLGKQYHARIIRVPKDKQGAEFNRGTGARAAKGDILLFVDHDNILPHRGWIRAMIQPFLDDPKMVGVETLHYTYDPLDSLIGRYFSLFGANDIFAYYVGKADRMPYFIDNPSRYGAFRNANVRDLGSYFAADFLSSSVPTLGSNGFMIRREILMKEANVGPDKFFHIDVNVDLIRKGFTRYAFIKDTLHHKTDERGLLDYLRRRKLFMQKYHFGSMSKRRYSLFEKGDMWKTIFFVIFGLTFIIPLWDALRGYRRIPDIAWFINPLMCFCLVILYGFVILERRILSYAHTILAK